MLNRGRLARHALLVAALVVLVASCGFLGDTDGRERNAAGASCDGNDQWARGVDLIVFLNPDASEEEMSDTRDELEHSEQVETFLFVSQAQAYNEFQAMFRDSDQIRGTVAVSDMPPSFRVSVWEPTVEKLASLAAFHRTRSGIFEVVERPTAC